MVDPRLLEEVLGRLSALVPPGLGQLQEDAARNLRAGVTAALERLNLVTREELEVQAAVLARTRATVDALQQRVAELEEALRQRDQET
jgi:hypothetical protein